MSFIFAIATIGIALYLLFWLIFGKKNTSLAKESSVEQTVAFPKQSFALLLISVLSFQVILYDVLTASTSETPSAGFALFSSIVTAALTYLLKDKIAKQRLLVAPIFLSFFLSLMMIMRANGFVQGINTLTIIAISWFLLAIYSLDSLTDQGLTVLKRLLNLFPQWFTQVFKFFNRSALPSEKMALSFQSFLKTILITFGVLITFTILLMNADPVFSEKVSTILEQSLGRFISSVVVAMISASILSLRIAYKEDKKESLSFLALQDLLVPMVAVSILFGFFITIQLQYLFAGKGDLTTYDLTYSEYVRKGFLELLFTAFLGGLFVYIAAIKTRVAQAVSNMKWLKIASSVVVLELFFLLASALKRNLMYIDVYGLTRVRIIGGVFVAWLAVILLSLIGLLLYKKLKEKAFLQIVMTVSAIAVLLFNIVNLDTFVVGGKPAHHTYTDHFYISNLSEDGASEWAKTIESIENDLQTVLSKPTLTEIEKSQLAGLKLSLIALQERRTALFAQYAPLEDLIAYGQKYNIRFEKENNVLSERYADRRRWQNYNYSEAQAYKRVSENKELYLNRVDSILENIRDYQDQNDISLYDEEYRLLFEFSYPFISIDLKYYPEDGYPRVPDPSPTVSPLPTSLPSSVPSSPEPATPVNFTLNQLLNNTCLLEPTAVYNTDVWVVKASRRDYIIYESNVTQNQPAARVILAEHIDMNRFDQNIPGYKRVSLKTSIKCDSPVIVYAE